MKILVVGSGGREHALAWKLACSPRISKVYVAPGNGGTALEPGVVNVPITKIPLLIQFAKREKIAFTVVGPEAPLAEGIVDQFRQAGLKIFGPTRYAAQLESSKDFAKQFMQRHRIPTAAYKTFSNAKAAHAYIDKHSAPIVIKADGLAAGKGVIIAADAEEAHRAVDMMLEQNTLGEAGAKVVIEEFLHGREMSFIAMVDGHNILSLATSQDHKRLLDDDKGPNTGGMGAYSPAVGTTPELHARIIREIINPVVQGLAEEGYLYTGFLYAGLMIDNKGYAKTLEFNCRLGDPETQPIMLRLKTDLVTLLEHGINRTLNQIEADWDRRTAMGVVLAAAGYPDKPRNGDIINDIPATSKDAHVFHAGTKLVDGKIVTAGGRVLCVTALGDNPRLAQQRAYEIADQITFEGRQMRRDIGKHAVQQKK